jgi:FkbM family methyltransferase
VDDFTRLLIRRTRRFRLARSLGYRFGERLARTRRLLTLELPSGSTITLSSRDHQHRHLYVHEEYEPNITALFQRIVKPGWIVFDVGANAGYFSLLARDLGAEAHAFEPNPEVRALLELSLTFDRERVVVVPGAVSDESGARVSLYLSGPGNTGMTSLTRITDRSVTVETITLDEYVRTSGRIPNLVKIDVEGYEQAVLRGALRLLSEAKPLLVIEVTMQSTIDLLVERGYVAHKVKGDGSVHKGGGFEPGEAGYENLLFASLRDEPQATYGNLADLPFAARR